MDEAFTTRLHALLAANPRICDNGCALAVWNPPGVYPRLVPKTVSYQPTPEEITRIYQLTLFIQEHLPDPPTSQGGWLRVGSYGAKHCFEKMPWKDGTNTYVSNTEGMVAMMLCGYVPKWNKKDPQDPNCVFSVRAKAWRTMATEAYRRFNERSQRRQTQPSPC